MSFDDVTGTLTFTSQSDGDALEPFSVDLPTVDDTLAEGPETFNVALGATGSTTGVATALSGDDNVDTTVTDNDVVTWSITGPDEQSEGTTASYTVALDGTLQAGEIVQVRIELTDIDTDSSDYGDLLTAIQSAAAANPNVMVDDIGTLTFTAPTDGATLDDLVIELPIETDALHESPEQFSIGLADAALLGPGGISPCLLYTSPSPRDQRGSRMPSSA